MCFRLQKSGQVVLGAVGAYQWQGAGYSYDINVNSLVGTEKKPQAFDDNYMGYATAIGEFTGDSQPEVVLGIPKGAQYNGSVEFYFREKDKLRKLGSNLVGPQLGSYFGSSLAVSDLNGDGHHDLVVGAPLFNSDYKGQGNPGEQGRVHVFYQFGNLEFREGSPLEGTIPKGRFGFAVAAIGDINKDGYNGERSYTTSSCSTCIKRVAVPQRFKSHPRLVSQISLWELRTPVMVLCTFSMVAQTA